MGKNKYYCRINGTIENLSDIQKLIDDKKFHDGKIILAMNENHGMDAIDAVTFEDVLEFNNWEIPADYSEVLEQLRENNRRRIANKQGRICPICSSTNIRIKKKRFIGGIWLNNPKPFTCSTCGHHWR